MTQLLEIPKRAFVFGGTYGNLQATRAILDEARRAGFSADEIIFTGDSVAYCGNPEETATLIRESGIHAIMGNCEEALAAGREDCGCGFEAESACSLLSVEWFRHCSTAISGETRAWMGSLPRSIDLRIGPFCFLCTHATEHSINRFVFKSDTQDDRFRGNAGGVYDGFLVGHSGIPFVTKLDHRLWINSGAAGMPANDGTARVWYAIVETDENGVTAQTRAVAYDFRAAQAAMQRAGLANGYQACLETGLWPSLDVLPETEKAATGKPLRKHKQRLRRPRIGQAAQVPAAC